MTPLRRLYIGVDNGVSGALVALPDVPGAPPLSCLPMPVQAHRKRNEINVRAVLEWLIPLAPLDQITFVIEEPGGTKSATAATSMSGSFHALRALCEVKRIRWHRITPQAWQKEMLPGCKTGDTKPAALATARRLWPVYGWPVMPRKHEPYDGVIDAALIAEFARLKQL